MADWTLKLKDKLREVGMLSELQDSFIKYLQADAEKRAGEILEYLRTPETKKKLNPRTLTLDPERFTGSFVRGLLGSETQVHYLNLRHEDKSVSLVLNRHNNWFYLSLNAHMGELWLRLPFVPKSFLKQIGDSMLVERKLDIVKTNIRGKGWVQNWPIAFASGTQQVGKQVSKTIEVPPEPWDEVFMRVYLWSFANVVRAYWQSLSNLSVTQKKVIRGDWFNQNYTTYIDFVFLIPFLYVANRIKMGLDNRYRYNKEEFGAFVEEFVKPFKDVYSQVTVQQGKPYMDVLYLTIITLIDTVESLLKTENGRITISTLWNTVIAMDKRLCSSVPNMKERRRLTDNARYFLRKIESTPSLKRLVRPFSRTSFDFYLSPSDLKYLKTDINVLKIALETYQTPTDTAESLSKIDIDADFALEWIQRANEVTSIRNLKSIMNLHEGVDNPTKRYRFLQKVKEHMTEENVKKVELYNRLLETRAIHDLQENQDLTPQHAKIVAARLCKRAFKEEPNPEKWRSKIKEIWRNRKRDPTFMVTIREEKKGLDLLRALLKYLGPQNNNSRRS